MFEETEAGVFRLSVKEMDPVFNADDTVIDIPFVNWGSFEFANVTDLQDALYAIFIVGYENY